jgi:hypothetical protein
MATDPAARAGLHQTEVPIPAVLGAHLTAARNPSVEVRRTGCRSVVVSTINVARDPRDRDMKVRAPRADSRSNSVLKGRDATASVTINDHVSRMAPDPAPTRRRERSGCMVTMRSPPLWRTPSAACGV